MINPLIAAYKETSDKINQLADDYAYDTKEDDSRDVQTLQNFDQKKHVWRYQRIEGEVDYACNVCDEGLDTEDDMKKYLNKYHQEILLNIWKESGDKVQNQNQDKKFKVLIK